MKVQKIILARYGIGLVIVLAVAIVLAVTPPAANAASFIVNDTADPGDGICDVTSCTLREAMTAAITAGGTNDITFSVSGTITLVSDLPTITSGNTLTIDGTGQSVTIDGAYAHRPFLFQSGSIGTLKNLTITKGLGPSSGTPNGGAIHNTGTLTVTNCSLTDNKSPNGGAILNDGTLTVADSTFSGNQATQSSIGLGGAIEHAASGNLTVTNSTFANNTAVGSGGGIFVGGTGTAIVTNSTFSGNSAGTGGSAIARISGGVTIKNTILANSVTGSNCSGTITNGGYNIDDANSCGLDILPIQGSMHNTNPQLGPLTGGVFPLNTNSPAIDGVKAGGRNGCPTTDQRGEARDDLYCDIGAYELTYTDSHYVMRNIQDTTTFAFGPALAEIDAPTGSTVFPGTTTVTRTAWTNFPANAVDWFWSISAATNSGLNLAVALCFTDLNGLAPNDLRLYGYSGGVWTTVGTFVVTNNTLHAPYYCTYTKDITDLSYTAYTLATGNPISTPTAANLVQFGARYNAKQDLVRVKWQTGVELDIVGFNVFRATKKDGVYKQLNADLIPSKYAGQVVGARYSLRDAKAKSDKTYFYKLQVVYANDTRAWSDLARVNVK